MENDEFPPFDDDLDDAQSPLAEWIQDQPWFRRYAKGLAAAAAALINIAWLLSVLPAGLVSPETAAVVAIVVQVIGGVAGVIATPNTVTTRQLAELTAVQTGRHHRP